MAKTNKYGLDRYIKAATKKKIRERCGFGCVICGTVPVEYHHHNIPFAEAKDHDPDDIVLLCDKHHKMTTNGILDANDISNALRQKTGLNSNARFNLESTKKDFYAIWAGNRFIANEQAVIIDGLPTLSFQLTNNPLEPVLISGIFQDHLGNLLCEIKNNEFVFRSENVGDFKVVKNRFLFKLPNGFNSLEFKLTSQLINISRIFHCQKDVYVFGEKGTLYVGNWSRGVRCTQMDYQNVVRAIGVASCFDRWIWEKKDIKSRKNKVLHNLTIQQSHYAVSVDGMIPSTTRAAIKL